VRQGCEGFPKDGNTALSGVIPLGGRVNGPALTPVKLKA
jgi:hypothetical protein